MIFCGGIFVGLVIGVLSLIYLIWVGAQEED
jgi:hypothetical protein